MKTHGEAGKSKTKEYRSWAGIISRCTNVTHRRYPEWGGRGITVCDRWRRYENFLSDMGRAPTPKHSIDRMENSKGYEKLNCRWATPVEQSNNTRRNVRVKYNGEEKTIPQWCDALNLSYKLVRVRLWKGWTVEKTFNSPKRKPGEVNHNAVLDAYQVKVIKDAINHGFSLKKIAEYFQTSPNNISRIKRGVTYSTVN